MSLFQAFEPEPAERRGAADVFIRRAAASDAEAIAHIRQERHGGGLERQLAHSRRWIARIADAPEQLLLVAVLDDEVTGYGYAGLFQPPDAPTLRNMAPGGYYLRGVVVRSSARRRGIGRRLTEARLSWIAERAEIAYYCANAANRATLAMHAEFGFEEVTRDFCYPGVRFEDGSGGILLCARLKPPL
ncbi:MAG TPA: GNAT family N-acetyltransferase [Polyangiaceae bacterium]|nr:GNAT family N-acetyltransferase [Polyangiaceae bacterium]